MKKNFLHYSFLIIIVVVGALVWFHLSLGEKRNLLASSHMLVHHAMESFIAGLKTKIDTRIGIVKSVKDMLVGDLSDDNQVNYNNIRFLLEGLLVGRNDISTVLLVRKNEVVFDYTNKAHLETTRLDGYFTPKVITEISNARANKHIFVSSPFVNRREDMNLAIGDVVTNYHADTGLVFLIFDISRLIHQMNTEDPHDNFPVEISIRDTHNIQLYGSPEVWGKSPVSMEVGHDLYFWHIGGIPEGGWNKSIEEKLVGYRILTAFIIMLIIGILLLFYYNRNLLKAAVEQKTSQLMEVNSSLHEVQTIARVAPWEWDYQAKVFKPSEDLLGVLGFPNPSLPLQNSLEFILEEDLEYFLGCLQETYENKGSFYCDCHVKGFGGKIFTMSASGKLVFLNQRPVLLKGVFQDITERVQTQTELHESNKKYLHLFENMIEGLAIHEIICDKSGKPIDYRFIDINPAFEQLTGLKREMLVGKTVLEVLPNTESYWIENYGRIALEGGHIHYENYSRELERYYEVNAYSNEPNHFVTIFSDITERKLHEAESQELYEFMENLNRELEEENAERQAIEEQLKELNEKLEIRVQEEINKNREKEILINKQNRLASMGELLTNIAHHWRQPLNKVGLIIQNVYEKYRLDSLEQDYMYANTQKALDEIVRMSNTIEEFKTLYVPNSTVETFQLSAMVQRSVKILKDIYRDFNIEIQLNLILENEPNVVGLSGDFTQCVLNILNNSKEKFEELKIENRVIRMVEELAEDLVILRIMDNAGGIKEWVLEKIFEPYFTTKPTGSGLGLYMAKLFIEKGMKGVLAVENILGGAMFTIKIPILKDMGV